MSFDHGWQHVPTVHLGTCLTSSLNLVGNVTRLHLPNRSSSHGWAADWADVVYSWNHRCVAFTLVSLVPVSIVVRGVYRRLELWNLTCFGRHTLSQVIMLLLLEKVAELLLLSSLRITHLVVLIYVPFIKLVSECLLLCPDSNSLLRWRLLTWEILRVRISSATRTLQEALVGWRTTQLSSFVPLLLVFYKFLCMRFLFSSGVDQLLLVLDLSLDLFLGVVVKEFGPLLSILLFSLKFFIFVFHSHVNMHFPVLLKCLSLQNLCLVIL